MKISEYVSIGHPDKTADYISEYILDRLLEQDPDTKYALEVQVKDNFVSLAGEITTNAQHIDYDGWVKKAIMHIGYTPAYAYKWGAQNTLDASFIEVEKHISLQSGDIAIGVENDGWGDQGIMFGMAVNTPETNYMPLDYFLAKKICQALYNSKKGGLDIKTQVVLTNNQVEKVIVAIPLLQDKREEIKEFVLDIIEPYCNIDNTKVIVNGTGTYIKHSSFGDCGTTGRKLAVDFYGGNCNIGGGSPWTKDGSKADLTLNLYARKKALDYIKEHNVPYAKCGIGCCIGKKEIDITIWDEKENELASYKENISPKRLIKIFELDKPIFADLCKNGLFERVC